MGKRGRFAWPNVAIAPDVFVQFLAEGRAMSRAGSERCIEDLSLACACLRNDSNALRRLSERLGQAPRTLVRRRLVRDDEMEELLQQFHVALLVGDGVRAPLLASYRGEAWPRAWIRLILVRRSWRTAQAEKRKTPLENDIVETVLCEQADPELAHAKNNYLPQFKTAFRETVRALSPACRNLLRLVVLDGLSEAQMGRLFGVHRSSVSRRLATIRHHLHREALEHLADGAGTTCAEAHGIVNLLESWLDVTLSGVLAQP